MKFDLSPQLVDLDGRPILRPVPTDDEQKPKFEPLSVAMASAGALVNPPKSPLTVEENVQRYALAMRILANPASLLLSAEDVVRIKTALPDQYGPLIVGQICALLEAAEQVGGKKKASPQ